MVPKNSPKSLQAYPGCGKGALLTHQSRKEFMHAESISQRLHLQELEGTAGEAIFPECLVKAVCKALQVAQHAAKAAKGQGALARAGIPNLSRPRTMLHLDCSQLLPNCEA